MYWKKNMHLKFTSVFSFRKVWGRKKMQEGLKFNGAREPLVYRARRYQFTQQKHENGT
jgi:hypothetical protein